MNVDSKLSEFITRTSADPGLARDLLEGHGWDLKNAINAFYVMDGTLSDGEVEASVDEGKLEDECDLFNTESFRPTTFKSMRIPSSRIMIGAINAKCSSEPSLASPSSPQNNYLTDKIEGEDASTTSSPSKLAVSRIDINDGDAIEDVYPKKLSRGISRATNNVTLVSKARNEFAHDFQLSARGSRVLTLDKASASLVDAPEYTFTLPDLSIHSPDFSEFLEKDLIEKSSLASLEGANRLNWWYNQGICQRLLPLATTGDGNCLLHAASLGMWGFHDRLLTLRKALHIILGSTRYSESFYRRWRYQTSISNEAAGLKLCEEEWEKEWNSLLKMSSSEPRIRGNNTATSAEPSATKSANLSGGKKEVSSSSSEYESNVYESLEEIHILALAHVLMRPIIIIADTVLKDVTGEPFAPIPFGGIYLPIEVDPSTCYRSPLCLTYDAAHFSALVAIDQETFADKTPPLPTAIPLVDSENKLLPLQFVMDPGVDVNWKDDVKNDNELNDESKIILLRKYLDVVEVKNPKVECTKEPEESSDKQVSDSQDVNHSYVGGANVDLEPIEKTADKSMTLPANLDVEITSQTGTARSTRSCPAGSSPSKSTSRSKWKMIRHRFGSLGRSFRKTFRRSYTSLSKRGTSFRKSWRKALGRNKTDSQSSKVATVPSSTSHHALAPSSNNSCTILCATLNTEKRHDYHEEMIRNYLTTARIRFLNHQKEKKSSPPSSTSCGSTSEAASPTSLSSSAELTKKEEPSADHTEVDGHFASPCVNTGCDSFGTSETSYLCLKCFHEQKKELSEITVTTPVKVDESSNHGEKEVTIMRPSNVEEENEEMAQIERKKLGSSCENLISNNFTSPSLAC